MIMNLYDSHLCHAHIHAHPDRKYIREIQNHCHIYRNKLILYNNCYIFNIFINIIYNTYMLV